MYWVANTVAILLLVSGAIMGWDEFLHPAFGPYSDFSPMALFFVFALVALLFGRACHYVLWRGANVSQIQTETPGHEQGR